MKIYYNTFDQIKNRKSLTLTFGNFDGLHKGHQQLIERVLKYKDTKHAILTFDPHPSSILRNQTFKTLSQKLDKIDLISQYPIDFAFIVKFDRQFSELSVDEFIRFLKQLSVKRLVLGRDARFAFRGQGTIEDLRKSFVVDVVPELVFDNIRVSTTYIKDFLQNGDLSSAEELLGRKYTVRGDVEHGDKVGKLLGFPTANVNYGNYFLPRVGVYYVKVKVEGKPYNGMANIGYNPTINYSNEKRLEIFIFNFKKEIYHKHMEVTFIQYIRDEIKFKNKESLIKQLKQDEVTVKNLIDLEVVV